MFAAANTLARNFTSPIIISFRKHSGECCSSLGTFVVINEQGWFVTAKHIMELLSNLGSSQIAYTNLLAQRKAIEEDPALKNHVKMQNLKKIPISPDAITNFSIWLGWDNVGFNNVMGCPNIDLAIGQLTNFNPAMVATYPIFKTPNQTMVPGTSLCKLGFPFHSIVPTFNGTNFELPPGSLPVPLFPIEGIFTRQINVPNTNPPLPYSLSYIETSTPGLKGQSGGPTFDVHGNIWAIQSMTQSYALGFGNQADKSKAAEHVKNQYLNVGLGVHSETITGFLTEKNVPFHSSSI